MKPKKLVFDWDKALKEAEKNHEQFMPFGKLDSVSCYDTSARGYEIRRVGIKKQKFVAYGYTSICLIPVGGHSKKLGEFETFEKAEEFCQKHFDNFVTSLCE